MVQTGWVALDVGARRHSFAERFGGKEGSGELENTPEAIARFLKARLGQCQTLRLLVEATGVYYLDLALQAAAAGAQVVVVNPKAAHHFAQALGLRNKTDAVDAKMLLAYLERMPHETWRPPSPERLALRQFGRHLGQLTDQRTRLKNQLHALVSHPGSPRLLREDLESAIADLDHRLDRLAVEAMKLVDAEPGLRERFDALDSIIGVGPATALVLLGELAILPPDMSAKACTCHAGLDVRTHQSGTSVAMAPRLSKHGNKHLRRALYMPAMVAIVHDPHAKAFRDRLLARGKKKMQALAAVMRKLLTAAWALMRRPAAYDGARLFAPG